MCFGIMQIDVGGTQEIWQLDNRTGLVTDKQQQNYSVHHPKFSLHRYLRHYNERKSI